ncbi:MAG: AraC family transcriptional regulator [Rikenellaceae bacterium]
MEPLLFKNMLFTSSFVMYAYGLFSFLTISPKGKEYQNYIAARRIFGSMMIVLSTCLLVHWNFDLRHQNPLLASSLCLLYITTGSMLLSVIFSSLIQSEYPFRKSLKEIALCTICLGMVLTVNYFFIPQEVQHITLIAAAIFFTVNVIFLTVQFYRLYRKTITKADNYYSDNISRLLVWIPITIYITILLVLAVAILSFATEVSFISLYLFLGLSIFTYIFISLQNYMINIAKMKMLLLSSEHEDTSSNNTEHQKNEIIEADSRKSKIVKLKLDKWIENKGFTQQGLTLDDLAIELNTNRTYLSSYINTFYHLSFRAWIASQRIEYSKELLMKDEELSSTTIASMVGYSPNAFIKTFTKTEGVSPAQWRNDNKIMINGASS